MTSSDRLGDDMVALAEGAVRLETIERRHRHLLAGFKRLSTEAKARHDCGSSGAVQIDRLVRLDQCLNRCDAEALQLAERLTKLLWPERDRG